MRSLYTHTTTLPTKCTGVLTCTVFFSKNLTRIAFKEKREDDNEEEKGAEKRKKNTIEKKEEAKILFH